jgi:heme-degrading monooxygenase HmoA
MPTRRCCATRSSPASRVVRSRGFGRSRVFRRDLADEVEFITVMWFDSMDAVRAFAGEDHDVSVVPPAARELLARFDERSQHYEVRERRIP